MEPGAHTYYASVATSNLNGKNKYSSSCAGDK